MNELVIPTAPLAVVTILGFLAPYAISFLNGLFDFVVKPLHRKILSVVVSLVLAGLGLAGYYVITGVPLPASAGEWFLFAFLAIVVTQTSYNLVTKKLGAEAIEERAEKIQ